MNDLMRLCSSNYKLGLPISSIIMITKISVLLHLKYELFWPVTAQSLSLLSNLQPEDASILYFEIPTMYLRLFPAILIFYST